MAGPWAQPLPLSGLPRERVGDPLPHPRCTAETLQQEIAAGSAESSRRPRREVQSVHSICELRRDWGEEGAAGVASLFTGQLLCPPVCPPRSVRLGSTEIIGQRWEMPRGRLFPYFWKQRIREEHARGAVPLGQRGRSGAHAAARSSRRTSFGTWAANSLSANLGVYFCGQV